MPQQGSTWVVESGENVFKIAEQLYGNQRMAFEILKMNGGNTVIQPGDVLSLPDYNDPNVYVGANQVQNVLDQRVKNDPNYTGPTTAAVPVSQQSPTGMTSTTTTTPTTSTAPVLPSVQQRFREADAASMAGAPQGATAVQTPNMPRPNISYPGGVPNARRTLPSGTQLSSGGKVFGRRTTAPVAPDMNTEVARAQRYQASGVPGTKLATAVPPTAAEVVPGQMYWNGKTWVTKGMEPAPVGPTNQQGRRDKGVSVQQSTAPSLVPTKAPGTTRFQSLLMEDQLRPTITDPTIVIPAHVQKGLMITASMFGGDPNVSAYLTAPVEEGGGGYVYDKMSGIYYPAGKVPTNVSLDYGLNIPEYDWNQSHEPNYGNYGYGNGGGGGGYTGGGGGYGVNSSSVASYSLSTRLATG